MIARYRPLAFTLVLLLGIAGGGVRAASGDEDGFHTQLTMARMQAYFNALMNLGLAACKDPKLSATMDKLSDASTPTPTIIAGYESSPAAKQAFKAAGLTTEQFVYIGNAYLSASFGLAAQQQLQGKPLVDKNHVFDAANVEFVKAHGKELEAMLNKMGKDKEKEAAAAGCKDND